MTWMGTTALQFGCYIEGSTLRFDLLYPFPKISPIQVRFTHNKNLILLKIIIARARLPLPHNQSANTRGAWVIGDAAFVRHGQTSQCY